MPYYLRMIVAALYIGLGLVLLTTNYGELLTGNKMYGIIIGLLFIVYGSFRFYRNQQNWGS